MTHVQKYRLHGTANYASADQSIIKLQRGMIVRSFFLRLVGGWTWAAAGNLKANINRGDEAAMISKIEILANSNDVLRSFTGPELRAFQFFIHNGVRPRVSSLLGSAVVIAKTDSVFDVVYEIPFCDPWSDKPMDTALDTTPLQDLRMVITWNTVGRGFGGDGTNNVTDASATAYVYAHESSANGGPYGDGSGNFVETAIKPIANSAAGAVTDQPVNLPLGPACRGLLINASTTANSQQTDKPLIVTNFKLVRGPELILDLPAPVVHQVGLLRINSAAGALFNEALTPPAAVTNGGYGPSNTVTAAADQGQYGYLDQSELSDLRAWYWIDLAPDGYLSEAIGTQGYPNFDLQYSTNAAVDLKIYPWSLYPAASTK